ncbi:MAG: hypothetical protein LBJ61_01960 [Deltaproteobacteria bacterium]|jgi:TPR repeat protein|nr:hypothetical protein [Deltaproteobacteria bacterium]
MKRISKGSVFIILPLIFGLWLWFSAESQPQNQPAKKGSSSVSGQLTPQPTVAQNTPAVTTPGQTDTEQPAGQRTITAEQLLTELEAQAKENNPRAMLLLGSLYERGINTTPKRNYGTALQWYQKAAAQDLAEGHYNVGVYYEVGMGTAPDMKKAVASFQKAADKGLGIAEIKLASLYLIGDGVTQDTAKGLGLLEKAADKNIPQALLDLGAVYYFGNFDKKRDLTKAKELFLKAADLGVPAAMQNLGVMALAGEGMEANKVQGLRWYLLAQKYGLNNPEMQTTIDGIKADFQAAEISAAEEEADKWSADFDAKVAAAQAAQQAAQEAAQATAPAN